MLERHRELEGAHGLALWAVELRATGQFIGQCGIQPVERAGPELELAYHFTQASWRNGFATEAAIAALAHGFGELGRLIAIVVPENVASCRVAEKAGLEYECLASYYGLATLRKYSAVVRRGDLRSTETPDGQAPAGCPQHRQTSPTPGAEARRQVDRRSASHRRGQRAFGLEKQSRTPPPGWRPARRTQNSGARDNVSGSRRLGTRA